MELPGLYYFHYPFHQFQLSSQFLDFGFIHLFFFRFHHNNFDKETFEILSKMILNSSFFFIFYQCKKSD